jgi:hypothetical protein
MLTLIKFFGSTNPATMYMALDFSICFPVTKRIKIYDRYSSLLNVQYIQAVAQESVGGGSALFKVVKNTTTGKYDLVCSLSLKLTLVAPEEIDLNEKRILEPL